MPRPQENWSCAGWGDHETFHLETGLRMSFRAKLQWLEEADRMVRFLAGKRRWIDKDGVVHERTLSVAEEQAPYSAGGAKSSADKPPGPHAQGHDGGPPMAG